MSTNNDALREALDLLDEIVLAGMSGTGMESPEAMMAFHAKQAWRFISIAAKAKEKLKALAASNPEPTTVGVPHLGPFASALLKEAESKPKPHPDDEAVDRFAHAMKQKLAQAREKGRGGWQECGHEDLSRMLRDHVEKGDPRDVANFCMMLWNRGERTVIEDQWVYDLFGVWPGLPAQPAERKPPQEMIEKAYKAGFVTCAIEWAARDDLLADVGSPAYKQEMKKALDTHGIKGES